MAAIAAAERVDGKLVSLTNVPDFNAAEVVERYKSQADLERGFRVLNSDLGERPPPITGYPNAAAPTR